MASRLATTSRCMVQCVHVTRCKHSIHLIQRSRSTFATTSHDIHAADAPPTRRNAASQGSSNLSSSQKHRIEAAPSQPRPPSSSTASQLSPVEADERVRQILLDRDGGPASVPTREGKWDSEMGRDTARQMFRVLDQTRQAKPGKQHAAGEGESKYWNRRNY